MYCNQCGKVIPDDAKFCQHCGSAIGTEQNNEPQANRIKNTIIITAIAVVVISLIAGFFIFFPFNKVVAEMPDPEYYFPVVSEVSEDDDFKRVIVRTEDELWPQVAEYVNLLKSGIYPFTSTYEEGYANGDYTWQFGYNNQDEIRKPYFCQIEVNYYAKSGEADHYAIWVTIHDIGSFELTCRESYEAPMISETDASDSESGMTPDAEDSIVQEPIVEEPIAKEPVDGGFDSDDDYDYEVPDASDIYDAETPCGVCSRSGDCRTCGGDGYLMSSASDKEDRNCYSCSGSGNCRSCGGDGWL